VSLSALRAGYPSSSGRFLVLISIRGWVDPRGHCAALRIGQIDNKFNYLIMNRTRDLPVCSIVPHMSRENDLSSDILRLKCLWGCIIIKYWHLSSHSYKKSLGSVLNIWWESKWAYGRSLWARNIFPLKLLAQDKTYHTNVLITIVFSVRSRSRGRD
jgi:hypothetical protein